MSDHSQELDRELRRRLRRHGAFLAGALLLLALAVATSLHAGWQRHLAGEAQALRGKAGVLVQRLDERLGALIVSFDELERAAHATPGRLADVAEGERRQQPTLIAIGLAAADGRVIVNADAGLARHHLDLALDHALRHHHATSGARMHVLTPLAVEGDGPLTVLSRAIRATSGELDGVAYAVIPVAAVFATIEPLRRGQSVRFTLVNEQMIVFGRVPAGGLGAEVSSGPTARMVSAGVQRASLRAPSPIDGSEFLGSFEVSQRFGFFALASIVVDEVFAQWLADSADLLIFVALVIVCATVLMFWLYHSLRRGAIAERRIQDSTAARFRDGIESMRDGFILWDRDNRLVAWNARTVEFLAHLTRPLARGQPYSQLVRDGARALLPAASEAEREAWCRTRESAFARADGTPRSFVTPAARTVEISDRRTANGDVITTYRDVTDERLAQERVAASEARFRDGIESMGEGFALWDRDGRLVTWNRRYLELLPHVTRHARPGVTLLEINTAAARDLYPDWTEERRQALVDRRLASRRQLGVPFELSMPGGDIVEIVDHPTGEGGHVSIFRDVTLARRAADRLTASEARFRDGIESLGVGFMMWDGEDRLAIWNRRVEAMLPYSRAVLMVGMRFEDYTRAAVAANHPDWTDELRERRIRERLEGHRQRQGRLEFWTLDGRLIELRDSPTSAGGCVSLYHDITERHVQAEKLERALDSEREMNAQQRRFVAMASHEFRTPLAIIDGATQRITARVAVSADADVAKRLVRIRGAVSRMTEMIDRTLSTARLDEGRISFDPATLDVGALLQEVCERQRGVAPQFQIELELDGADLAVHGDPRLLDQVFTNLVSNAMKYSGSELRAEIVARVVDDAVEIAVRDHGIGVPADEIGKLFTRFFRARSAAGIPGTGIGLNLVKEFVELHRGTVRAEANPDGGMTFTVALPRRADVPLRAAL